MPGPESHREELEDAVKELKLVIPGKLPGLNEYSDMERRNPRGAARLKRETQEYIRWAVKGQARKARFEGPVHMSYLWVEPDRRRDKDNIAFARKFVQDALVGLGVLHNDGWAWVEGFEDSFAVDKGNPRVEVRIWEV